MLSAESRYRLFFYFIQRNFAVGVQLGQYSRSQQVNARVLCWQPQYDQRVFHMAWFILSMFTLHMWRKDGQLTFQPDPIGRANRGIRMTLCSVSLLQLLCRLQVVNHRLWFEEMAGSRAFHGYTRLFFLFSAFFLPVKTRQQAVSTTLFYRSIPPPAALHCLQTTLRADLFRQHWEE